MNNNVYVRSNKSLKTITLTRILFIIPLVIYGFYKNGIFLYRNEYISLIGLLKPLVIMFSGAFIGAIINLIYEYLIKKRKEKFLDALFSSFHIEYGLLLGCIMPININLIAYLITLTTLFFISKFINLRINIMALIFIITYLICNQFYSFEYANVYELSKSFSLDFLDYLIGRGSGGIGATHIILILVALIGLLVTNNNKTSITMYSILSFTILMFVYSLIKDIDFNALVFTDSYIFVFSFITTDFITSCYTTKGMKIFGILNGILTFIFCLVNPVLAPFISTIIISLFNNLIDRQSNILKKR